MTEPPCDISGENPVPARRPVIPAALRRENLPGTVRWHGGMAWHRARYHGFRLPAYVTVTLYHALRGVFVIAGRIHRWRSWPHGWVLESQAVARGQAGHHDALAANKRRMDITAARSRILAVTAGGVLLLMVVAVRVLPVWAWPVAALALLVVLARHGRPPGRQVVTPAVVPPRYEIPTPAVITRALAAVGIAPLTRAIETGGLNFVSDVHRDGDGWGCDVDLPHGVTARMILQRREQLSAGLRRPLSATWPEGVPHEHEGRLRLWIGFEDMSKRPARTYPLLKTGQADVFGPVPFATDPRGRPVTVPLFEANWLIGSAPGNGKTSTVRVLASAAALDPVADLWVHELAGKGDLEPLAQVAHRYVSGLDDESVAYAAESLSLLRSELARRSDLFKKIPREDRPDGKLTRRLAEHDRRLRPVVCVVDECQALLSHPDYGSQAAADATRVAQQGRAYGLILVLATQRPDKESLPTSVSGVVTARFCLKVPDQVANDMILGTGAYRAGWSAVSFRHEIDAGLGWLRGTADPQAVRTYYLDLNATARVAARARAVRSQAGVLSGYALGVEDGGLPRDVLADVLAVFGGDSGVQWPALAGRLAAAFPDRWADVTAEAVSAQCRTLGVPSVDVKTAGSVRKGCRRPDVEAVTR